MKNVLQYYYNLNPISIHRFNENYKCLINNQEYLFYQVEKTVQEVLDIQKLSAYLLKKGIPCHQIMLNINDLPLTYVDGLSYVLLRIFVANREFKYEDLLTFSNQIIEKGSFAFLERHKWYELWTQTIDYIEYQTSQFGKNYPIIRQSINYYIGLAETAISLISDEDSRNLYLSISHKRIKSKYKLQDLYNPLYLIIDTRVRDLSEFLKESFFSAEDNIDMKNLAEKLFSYKPNNDEVIRFFARMIYPTYYFDCYQEIILGNLDEQSIKKYIFKANKYHSFLRELYIFLKQYYKIPEIEWILKT